MGAGADVMPAKPSSVAAVIPLYNKGPHVLRALHAALHQSIPVDEIIVVDDASTDDGPALVAACEDPRIRLLRRSEPGPGGYAARNLAIEQAGSEWIAFLDADDSWRADAMAEVHRLVALADDGVSCLFTAYDRDYGDKVEPVRLFEAIIPDGTRRFGFDAFATAWLTVGQSPMWTSAVVARRRALLSAGLFPGDDCRRGGDKDMWLRLLRVGDAIGSSKVTATYHRDSVNMVTKTTSMNHSPYLCGTLRRMLPTGSEVSDGLIKKLVNQEIYTAAREAFRTDGRVTSVVHRDFFVGHGALRYLEVLLMRLVPSWLWKRARALRPRRT